MKTKTNEITGKQVAEIINKSKETEVVQIIESSKGNGDLRIYFDDGMFIQYIELNEANLNDKKEIIDNIKVCDLFLYFQHEDWNTKNISRFSLDKMEIGILKGTYSFEEVETWYPKESPQRKNMEFLKSKTLTHLIGGN